MITKDILNYQVKYLCRTVYQRDRLCKHLKSAGYTQVGYKYKASNDPRLDPEMLYIVTKGTTFELIPGNRGTWEHPVPIDARSEGDLFKLLNISSPERLFTKEDLKHFAEYCRTVPFDIEDAFKRKYEL